MPDLGIHIYSPGVVTEEPRLTAFDLERLKHVVDTRYGVERPLFVEGVYYHHLAFEDGTTDWPGTPFAFADLMIARLPRGVAYGVVGHCAVFPHQPKAEYLQHFFASLVELAGTLDLYFLSIGVGPFELEHFGGHATFQKAGFMVAAKPDPANPTGCTVYQRVVHAHTS